MTFALKLTCVFLFFKDEMDSAPSVFIIELCVKTHNVLSLLYSHNFYFKNQCLFIQFFPGSHIKVLCEISIVFIYKVSR